MSDEYTKRQDVLGIALDIHGARTGSHPDLSTVDLEFAKKYLEGRLRGWVDYGKHTRVFDEAVRLLLTVAIIEAGEELERRQGAKHDG